MVFTDKLYIAKIIKNARVESKLTQAQLAEKIDISVQQLSRIEVGTYIPSVPTFLKIIDILNISLEDFGVNVSINKNHLRDELVKKFYSMTEIELKCCNNAIDAALKNYEIIKSNNKKR